MCSRVDMQTHASQALTHPNPHRKFLTFWPQGQCMQTTRERPPTTDSIRDSIRILTPDSIRDSIRTQTADSQVPTNTTVLWLWFCPGQPG